jgi:two-component system, chemotaxis family, sensor kinase CheA
MDPILQRFRDKFIDEANGLLDRLEKDLLDLTWYILLTTNKQQFFRGISLINIFKGLSLLGTYEIQKIQDLSTAETDTWSIFLNTEARESEISEVFLFVEEDCTIVNLAKGNIIDKKQETEMVNESESKEISILNYIEDSVKQKSKKLTKGNPVNSEKATSTSIKRIPVDSTKLDHLMFLVSELITVNSQLNLSSRDRAYHKLRPFLEKIDNLSKQFRNNVIEIRLVPLGDTVLRFQRLIRELSKQLNKKVEFVTKGTNTELDKNTIDQLAEPLMHLIRNCLDHGIESPEERIKKGKPETGSITMSAYNSGNNVFIDISDDGNGIDVEKVRQKAIDKKIINPNDKLEKKDIFDFIFMPGFSTAQSYCNNG